MKFTSFKVLLLIVISITAKAQVVSTNQVEVNIDLVKINNDRVKVMVKPATIVSDTIVFSFPRIIPGTYAIADYGRYIDELQAIDESGKSMNTLKKDVNTWIIPNAKKLANISYYVNDTYDSEIGSAFEDDSTNTIFSPAGTNILKGKQFMLNMAGFVGYVSSQKNIKYQIKIKHPSSLVGSSSMNDMDDRSNFDVFEVERYADLIDSPVMYAPNDIATTNINGMNVVLHVYSPVNKNITANALMPDIQKMMQAQKKFLGNINHTQKYVILVYVTSNEKDDARGIGALEHNTSTTSVFLPSMSSEDLIHVISHEFFHTLTPLNVHSKEIQDFDFNEPQMSAHLWMYEGITEYFAHLFQVREGLITENDFFAEMAEKEFLAKKLYPQQVSFTEMSKNILNPEMKKIYPNVYQKGALFAMCIDLIMREQSKGEKGILEMMGQLATMYGPHKPFDDNEIIDVITKNTYPEVGDFIQRYIVKGDSLNVVDYLKLAGVDRALVKLPVPIAFIVENKPYIKIDQAKKLVYINTIDDNNEFIKGMGLMNNDVLLAVNGQVVDATDMVSILGGVYHLKEGKPMEIKVEREGKVIVLKGNAKLNLVDTPSFGFVNSEKINFKKNWLNTGQ